MNKIFLYLILLLIGISGCSPAYIPNTVNVPLLSEKGETQISFNTGVSGFDPQASYAITDKFGVMVNGSFLNKTSDTTNNFHQHNFIEGGIGYYKNLGFGGRFEIFTGLGGGKLRSQFDNNIWIDYNDVKYSRFFIQPTIGATSQIFDGALSTRFVVVNMKQNYNKEVGVFFEPVLTGKVGYEYVKMMLQLGFSLPISRSNLVLKYQPILLSIGIQAKIK